MRVTPPGLERLSIDEYWNISGVPVLPETMIFMFLRICWCYLEAHDTGVLKWFSIVQCLCNLGLKVNFLPKWKKKKKKELGLKFVIIVTSQKVFIPVVFVIQMN